MKAVLLLVVTLIAASQAVGSPVKVEYNFTFDVRTGSLRPVPYASGFVLKGQLVVYSQELSPGLDNVYFKFTNPKIYDFNGQYPMESKNKFLETYFYEFTSKQITEYFEKPFYAQYTKGTTHDFFTETTDEPSWIRNLKRNIVSAWQLADAPDGVKIADQTAYVAQESTLYGECPVQFVYLLDYPTNYSTDRHYYIKKSFDAEKCDKYELYDVSTVETIECETITPDDDLYINSVERNYYVKYIPGTDETYIDYYEGTGSTTYYPFRNAGEYYFSRTNQTIEALTAAVITESDLLYTPTTFTHKYTLVAEAFSTEEEIIENIAYNFYDYEANFEDDLDLCVRGIKGVTTNYTESEIFNYVIYKFAHFTEKDFTKCHKELIKSGSQKDVEIFYNILSNVGTRTAILYIKNILTNYQVKTSVAREVVQNLPFSVVFPTPQLLDDLYDLVNGKIPLKDDVRTATILGYASLVYLTFKNPSVSNEKNIETYVDLYYNNLIKAETYNEQLIWLHGLRNIELGGVFNYLSKIVRGEVKFAVDVNYDGIREQAIWGLEKYVTKQQQDVYNIVWPIVIDSRGELAHRVAAVHVYVVGIKTPAEIEALFWFMQYTQNVQFYNYFSTLVKSYQSKSNHCNNVISHFADDIEIYSQNFGKDYNTQFYAYEEYDEFYGIGGKISGVLLADNVTNNYNAFTFKFEPYMSEQKYVAQEYYLKFGKAFDAISRLLTFVGGKKQYESLKTRFANHTLKPQFEFAQFTHTRAVFVKYYDITTEEVDESFSIKSLMKSTKKSFWTVSTVFDQDRIFFTEIGLPLSISFRAPLIVDINYSSLLDLENMKFSLDFDIINQFDGYYGLRVFNQYSKLWSGVARVFNYQTNFPISFSIEPDDNENLRFGVDTSLFDNDRVIGLKTFTETRVFLEHATDVNYVSEHLNTSKYFATTRQDSEFIDEYKETFNFYDEFGFGVYFKSQVEIYPEAELDPNWDSSSYTYQFYTTPWLQSIITYRNYVLTHLLSPNVVYSYHNFKLVRVGDSPVQHIYFTYILGESESIPSTWANSNYNHDLFVNVTIEKEDPTRNVLWETAFYGSFNDDNVYDFAFEAYRSTNNHPYYLFSVKFDKNVEEDSATGSFQFTFEEQWQKKFFDSQYYINVDWRGEKSDQQLNSDVNKHFTYKSCAKHSEYLSQYNPTSYSCIYDLTSLRYTLYNVDYYLPDSTTNHISGKWGEIASNYLTSTSHETTAISSGLQVEVFYPFNYDRGYADVTINYPGDFSEHLSGVYHGSTSFFDYDSTHISGLFDTFKRANLISECRVQLSANETLNYGTLHRIVSLKSNDYVQLLASTDSTDDNAWGLYARNFDNHGFDVKLVLQNYTSAIEIDRSKFTENGAFEYNFIFDSNYYFYHMTDSNYHSEDILKSKIFKYNHDNIIAVPDLGLVVIFDEREIKISYFGFVEDYTGECVATI